MNMCIRKPKTWGFVIFYFTYSTPSKLCVRMLFQYLNVTALLNFFG